MRFPSFIVILFNIFLLFLQLFLKYINTDFVCQQAGSRDTLHKTAFSLRYFLYTRIFSLLFKVSWGLLFPTGNSIPYSPGSASTRSLWLGACICEPPINSTLEICTLFLPKNAHCRVLSLFLLLLCRQCRLLLLLLGLFFFSLLRLAISVDSRTGVQLPLIQLTGGLSLGLGLGLCACVSVDQFARCQMVRDLAPALLVSAPRH